MLDNESTEPTAPDAQPEAEQPDAADTTDTTAAPVVKRTTRKRATKAAGTPAPVPAADAVADPVTEEPAPAPAAADAAAKPKKATKKAAAQKTAEKKPQKATKKASAKKKASSKASDDAEQLPSEEPSETPGPDESAPSTTAVLFQAPKATSTPRKRASRKQAAPGPADQPAESEQASDDESAGDVALEPATETARDDLTESGAAGDDERDDKDESADEGGSRRRPRRRGGRRRRKGSGDDEQSAGDGDKDGVESSDGSPDAGDDTNGTDGDNGADSSDGESGSSRRRRRRRRPDGNGADPDGGESGGGSGGGRARRTRNPEDEITALSGSTRLEAKRQRRREGREAGRRRAPIVSEAEFLARRESVERVMVVRQRDELTQIAVLEDDVLVEHYVARESQTSLIGNVYLGRVQNVLPSMEAAFIDIGRGRNAVLYAGEVNWTALGAKDGQPRKIESVLKSGQPILVQVTKDPIGHKGARLTSQVSLPGRFLVLVPDGTTSGISRKLPENERHRLKTLLKEIVPDTAGVIVRTAAEGATEEELTQDVERLTTRWSDIDAKVGAGGGKGGAPQLLYGEPDLTLKVVRDLFTEDFSKLVVQGDGAWTLVDDYVAQVAPDLRERLEQYQPDDHDGADVFGSYRLDEQIAKGLDRKVWLPSGGSLIIDRTEAMTVIDVNTGKFTGSGGNLEETVTKNNLESAEEIVRQLRLRDIGGIVVIDFIDMVLESNRDLVLRRLVECLGRDRTRHQVAEVTSLGLVQMTRKRIGTGLLEAFSENCAHCHGRGLTIHDHPIEPSQRAEEGERHGGRRGKGGNDPNGSGRGRAGRAPTPATHAPSPADIAAMPRHDAAYTPPTLSKSNAPAPEAADEAETPVDTTADTTAPSGSDSGPDSELTDAPVDGAAPVPEPTTAPAVEETVTDEPVARAVPEEAVPAEPVLAEPVLAEPVPDTASAPAEPSEPAAEAVPEPAEPPAEPAPTVVSSSRRRSARRAAGPPAAAPSNGHAAASEESTDGGAAPGGDGDEAGDDDAAVDTDDAGFVLHVPIKRRGARKR